MRNFYLYKILYTSAANTAEATRAKIISKGFIASVRNYSFRRQNFYGREG